jgi:hypothetical protein
VQLLRNGLTGYPVSSRAHSTGNDRQPWLRPSPGRQTECFGPYYPKAISKSTPNRFRNRSSPNSWALISRSIQVQILPLSATVTGHRGRCATHGTSFCKLLPALFAARDRPLGSELCISCPRLASTRECHAEAIASSTQSLSMDRLPFAGRPHPWLS